MSGNIAVVTQLPPSPGDTSKFNDINTQLTLMQCQSNADAVYDPQSPPPKTPPKYIQPFCSGPSDPSMRNYMMLSKVLFVIGGVCVIYGIIRK